jgi:hypothetical protein
MDKIAMQVAKDLDFNVTGPKYKPLQHHSVISKRRQCLALCAVQSGIQVRDGLNHPNATATPACYGLDQERKTNALRFGSQAIHTLIGLPIAGEYWGPNLNGDGLGPIL